MTRMLKDVLTSIIESLRSRPWMRSHLKVILRDLFSRDDATRVDDDWQLRCAIDWLTYAQDVTADGGVSAGYSFRRGWLPSYPETTGYIIPTFVKYSHYSGDEEYLHRAVRMADWLVSIQLEDGAFRGRYGRVCDKPVVFNTGQALDGFTSVYQETCKVEYLQAARKAGGWLVQIQDEDGAWRRFAYNGVPHVYSARVAWPLLCLYKLTSEEAFLRAAEKNVQWALGNQETNGWFRNNAFHSRRAPLLHTIGYAIEGLLECAALSQNRSWLEAVVRGAEPLLTAFELNGMLKGRYNVNWEPTVAYRCLTGEAQICLCWLRLFQLTGNARFLNAARKMSHGLKRLQSAGPVRNGTGGGIKGSHPIWGGYMPYVYPNWAAKFFVDALILEKTVSIGSKQIRDDA